MATNYPSALDNFVNPSASDTLGSGAVTHADQHTNINDAMEAVQTILGINPAGSHLTIKDRIISAEQLIAAQSYISGLADITIEEVSNGDVLRYNGSTWENYSEENLVDGGNF